VGLCAEHADDVPAAEALVSYAERAERAERAENEDEFVGERLIAACVTYLREYRSFYHPHVRLQVSIECAVQDHFSHFGPGAPPDITKTTVRFMGGISR
jgi:hypothetical protein